MNPDKTYGKTTNKRSQSRNNERTKATKSWDTSEDLNTKKINTLMKSAHFRLKFWILQLQFERRSSKIKFCFARGQENLRTIIRDQNVSSTIEAMQPMLGCCTCMRLMLLYLFPYFLYIAPFLIFYPALQGLIAFYFSSILLSCYCIIAKELNEDPNQSSWPKSILGYKQDQPKFPVCIISILYSKLNWTIWQSLLASKW